MNWLSDLPVQRKLGYAMLLTSTVASVLACGIFLAVEYISDRGNLEHTVSTLARITADNSTAAIAFADRKGAQQNLDALRAEPQITTATLYDASGQVFARYDSHTEESVPIALASPVGLHFANGRIFAVQPVMEGTRRLGTLHLQASLAQIYERMRVFSFIILGVMASSFGLAGLIASVLRRTLARPILELASTAVAVTTRQDYSLRARQYGDDELGQLTTTFNEMLQRTQSAVDGLRESEWTHRELVRALPTAAYMCDAAGRITLVNEAALALWGRVPEIGREYWSGSYRMYRPDGSELPVEQCPMAVAQRESRAVRGEEIIIERPDGSRRNVLPHPEPLRDTAGMVVGLVTMLLDVTEQKRASAAARQLAAIVESSDDAIIGKNLDGIITAWNRGAERLYGFTSEEMIGQPVLRLIPADREDEEPDILARIQRNERIEHYQTVRRRRDGSLVDVSLTVSPIKDASGRIIGASKIARDVTESKRAQQQANFLSQLHQQLSAFATPAEIMRAAARLLGEYLGTDRCYFCTFNKEATFVTVKEDWARAGFPNISGVHQARDFGTPAMWQALTSGPLSIPDKSTHELTRNQGAGYDAVRIGAHATAPLFGEGGELLATIAVATERPRFWRQDELGFLENALARVWPMIQRARVQQELQESERHQQKTAESLNLAIASANLGTWNWDAATDLMTLAPRTREIYGIPSASPQTRTKLRDLLHPDDRDRARQELQRAMAEHSDYDIEYRVVRPDGTLRWVAAKGRSLYVGNGPVTGMVGVIQDITERKLHEQALEELSRQIKIQAQLFDATLSSITDLAYYFDLQGRWIYANRPLLDLWGRTLEEITGKSCLELGYPPELAARLEAQVQQVIATKSPVRGETAYAAADGKIDDHEYIFSPVLDAQGTVTAVVGTTRLITERKRAEETLRQSEEQLRLVTDNAPIFLVRTDLQHRFTFVNRAYAERNGSKPADMIGRSVTEVVGPLAYETFKPKMDQAIAGARVEFEMEVPYDHIGRRWVHVIYVPERDLQGQVTGLLGVISDIGARKEAEHELKRARDEALAASRAKDDFLAALSHELRTPLNPVLLLASDAANNPELPAAVRSDFDFIRKNVHLEARLIDDLLDLTRITRGKLTLQHGLCDLHTVLRDALANVAPDLREKGLHLTADLAAEKPTVVGDSVRLQQVFWNVLKNAVKFTPENGQITVKTALVPAGDRVTVTITDSGIGMTPEELKRAFDAFSQGDHASDDSATHRFGGLGLGLAISKMLVDRHAGHVQAFSAGRHQGATFLIDLPLSIARVNRSQSGNPQRAATVPPLPALAVATAPTVPASPRRILLVEDHAATRVTLQQLLRNRRHQVMVAESAAKATELARAHEFDLIISDVGLPDRNGYELMAGLRAAHPGLPGIALSGYGMEDDLQRSRAAGFAFHLVKPVTVGMLEEAIASLPPRPAADPSVNPTQP